MNAPDLVVATQPDFASLLVSSTGFLHNGLDRFISTSSGDGKLVEFLNYLFPTACREGASDIHMRHHQNGFQVRIRTDGVLRERFLLNSNAAREINVKIRSRCNLEVSDTESPLDGKFTVAVDGRRVDIRVSILPSDLGQSIVCRILDEANAARKIADIWMPSKLRAALMEALEEEEGLILNVGPTGSGKTTTLYACLDHLNEPDIHIMTAEDPIEYTLRGATQTAVTAHRTFARILRAMLRQDFEAGLIGEIRDGETAGVTLTAANTGHLMLSTLHTRNALSTITRFLDLGVKAYEIADAIRLITAQRLPRMLCPSCSTLHVPTDEQIKRIKTKHGGSRIEFDRPFYAANPSGCDHCRDGYKGRIPIMEMLVGTDSLRVAIERGDREAMREEAFAQPQYAPLLQAGIDMSSQRLVDFRTALKFAQ